MITLPLLCEVLEGYHAQGMDRMIHNAYEVLMEGRVSMRKRNGLKFSQATDGEITVSPFLRTKIEL